MRKTLSIMPAPVPAAVPALPPLVGMLLNGMGIDADSLLKEAGQFLEQAQQIRQTVEEHFQKVIDAIEAHAHESRIAHGKILAAVCGDELPAGDNSPGFYDGLDPAVFEPELYK